MIYIGLVDDHHIVRSALREHLSTQVDMRVTGEARNAQSALDLAQDAALNVMVLDLGLPDTSGMNIISQLQQQSPHVRILVLSGYPESLYAQTALRLGASGYINKERPPEDIVEAVRVVAVGGRYASAEVRKSLSELHGRAKAGPLHEGLSAREMQVFLALAAGKRISQVAIDMQLSVKTASTYRSRVLEKMQMSSNGEMTRYALEHALIT
jgi:two-component system invasion response regulator UvrY